VAEGAVVGGNGVTNGKDKGVFGFIKGLVVPLMVFLPKKKVLGNGRVIKDWNMTFIALALFGYLLSAGLYQLKYLYAEHVFGWDATQLSYYITAIGAARACYLLFGMPLLVAIFKPTSKPQSNGNNIPPDSVTVKGKKPKPSKEHLEAEMRFDLRLSYMSYIVDFFSHALVSLSSTAPTTAAQLSFAGFTMLSSVGSGVVPSLQSLALCIMQADLAEESGENVNAQPVGGAGSLFGAFAVLQATGQMIIGPMLFGLVYSTTVATFPKGIFVLAASFVLLAVTLLAFVRTPRSPGSKTSRTSKNKTNRQWGNDEVERGRSRVSKDLSGGVNGRHPVVGGTEDD